MNPPGFKVVIMRRNTSGSSVEETSRMDTQAKNHDHPISKTASDLYRNSCVSESKATKFRVPSTGVTQYPNSRNAFVSRSDPQPKFRIAASGDRWVRKRSCISENPTASVYANTSSRSVQSNSMFYSCCDSPISSQ